MHNTQLRDYIVRPNFEYCIASMIHARYTVHRVGAKTVAFFMLLPKSEQWGGGGRGAWFHGSMVPWFHASGNNI